MAKRKLQVFVSSTYSDLKDERQAAVSAILKAGHIPAGMELFTAGDQSQMKTIERWIDESDVYMLILGGRYGSIEKVSGISYTELEYDYASERGKAMFSVVTNAVALEEKVRIRGTDFLERENPKELALFKEKVLSNISSFFSDEKDIRLCVHESLAEFVERRDLKGWISASTIDDGEVLQDELRRLREENTSLRAVVNSVDRTTVTLGPMPKNPTNFEEVKMILKSIPIKIPATVLKQKVETTQDLLTLFVRLQDVLVAGVTNSGASEEIVTFVYHNICPKLQVHGLVENEKVVGVQYRRSAVSKLGLEFLAFLDAESIAKKSVEGVAA